MAYQRLFKLKGATTAAASTISASNFSKSLCKSTNTGCCYYGYGKTIFYCYRINDTSNCCGDSVIIEKEESHTVETSGNAVGSAISSSR